MQIHTTSIVGWRWIYIIEGAFTILAGLVAWFFLVDFPQQAKFLEEHERERVIERLNEDRGDGDHDGLSAAKIWKHLSDWKVWGFGLIVSSSLNDGNPVLWNNSGTLCPCVLYPVLSLLCINLFSRVILNDMGFSVALSLLLVAPPYILAVIVALATSWWADKIHHRTPFILVHSTIAILGFVLVASSSLPIGVRLFGVFLATAGAVPNQPAVLAFAQNNIVGTSKRAIVSCMQVAFGSIGGIAASTVYRQQDAPKYLPGYEYARTRLTIVWVQLWRLRGSRVCLLCRWRSSSIERISKQIEMTAFLKGAVGSDIPRKTEVYTDLAIC